jgi:hypothetical protein
LRQRGRSNNTGQDCDKSHPQQHRATRERTRHRATTFLATSQLSLNLLPAEARR